MAINVNGERSYFIAVGIIYYGIVAISDTTIYSNIYDTISISRVRRAVGIVNIVATSDGTTRPHDPRIVVVVRVRRAKQKNKG